MNKRNNLIIFLVIILATFSRLFITIPNFSAIGALALFCGAMINRGKYSVFIPFAALLAGDLILAATGKLYSDYFADGYFIYVYVGFALTWMIGRLLKNKVNVSNIVLASIAASLTFFIVTNFGSWLQISYYPKTINGLGQAYLAGLVFYKQDILSNFFLNQLIADLFFSSVFFGGYAMIIKNHEEELVPIKVKSK